MDTPKKKFLDKVDEILIHADQRGGVWLGLMTFQSCLMAWFEGFFPSVFKVPTWWYAFYVVVFTGFTVNGTIKSSRNKSSDSNMVATPVT